MQHAHVGRSSSGDVLPLDVTSINLATARLLFSRLFQEMCIHAAERAVIGEHFRG